MIPLGKSLLPPDVLAAFPDDLPDEASFIFWSGWQRATAARDEYWEAKLAVLEARLDARGFAPAGGEAIVIPPIADPPAPPVDTGPPTAYQAERDRERDIYAPPKMAPDGSISEEPIGRFPVERIEEVIAFAKDNSTDPARARLIARECLADAAPNYRDGNLPGSIVRIIMGRLENEGLRGDPVQALGDSDGISDEEVDTSAFGDEMAR